MTFFSTVTVSLFSFVLLIAQEKAPEAPPAGPPAGGAGGGGTFSSFLIPLLLCLVVIYVFMMMPERKKQKARQLMLKGMKKGDQVVTTAGILGKITKVEDKIVVLQVDRDNDVRIPFLKSAIHEVVPEAAEAKEDSK